MTAAPGPLAVRVTVADAWRTFTIPVSAGECVAAVKRRALAAASIDPDRAAGYEVKVGGALVRDEATPLGDLRVREGEPLVVLWRRRRAAR